MSTQPQPKVASKVLPTTTAKTTHVPSTAIKNPKAVNKHSISATPLRVVNEQVAKLESEIDDLLS